MPVELKPRSIALLQLSAFSCESRATRSTCTVSAESAVSSASDCGVPSSDVVASSCSASGFTSAGGTSSAVSDSGTSSS